MADQSLTFALGMAALWMEFALGLALAGGDKDGAFRFVEAGRAPQPDSAEAQ